MIFQKLFMVGVLGLGLVGSSVSHAAASMEDFVIFDSLGAMYHEFSTSAANGDGHATKDSVACKAKNTHPAGGRSLGTPTGYAAPAAAPKGAQ
ncbi:hypothetical protein [Kordiimonas pumila]|uniref:Uncharacterized protein n=1 Tax=Kordiimonas pumila TaxID=2161677 RepID=A0ABV7D2N9_9PROT|nr:hypothetical protein [Kordiimonas pumila]